MEFFTSQESQFRKSKMEALQNAGIPCYPSKYDVSHRIQELKQACQDNAFDLSKTPEELAHSNTTSVSIAGRISHIRTHGKLGFIRIKDQSDDIQGSFIVDISQVITPAGVQDSIEIENETLSAFKFIEKYIDLGDFVGISGDMFITKKGEVTILIKELTLLSKTLYPLPEKYHGLQDHEIRLRKRYLDILLHEDVKAMVIRKHGYYKAMREFLQNYGFIEVETPVLERTTGGWDANPFATHHNALDIDVYLRISAGELWQKRLMVGSLEKTFEIGRIFRNEGMSPEHAQDYSQMEIYWAYKDYRDMMNLMKEMYLHIADTVYGTREFEIRGHKVNLNDEWREVDYTNEVKERTGIDIFNDSPDIMKQKLKELWVESEGDNRPRLVDALWKYCRKQISGPAFLVNEPKFVSPLSKCSLENPEITERFHIILAGSEVGNGYSELNDPIDQKERFEEQQALRDAGDEEAQMADWDFIEALMHGMPPTAGFGVSERLFSFLEDRPIREIQIFPLMKESEE